MMRIWISALICAAVSSTATAGVINFSPDDYAIGTDVSHALPGVTLTHISNFTPPTGPVGPFVEAPVIIQGDDGWAVSGTNHFGTYGWTLDYVLSLNPEYHGLPSDFEPGPVYAALRVDFLHPVDYIAISGAYAADPPVIFAFDRNGNLLQTCSHVRPGCQVTNLGTATHPEENLATIYHQRVELYAPGISFVVLGASAHAGVARLDDFAYSVPEPTSIVLLGLGLAGIAATRRRRA